MESAVMSLVKNVTSGAMKVVNYNVLLISSQNSNNVNCILKSVSLWRFVGTRATLSEICSRMRISRSRMFCGWCVLQPSFWELWKLCSKLDCFVYFRMLYWKRCDQPCGAARTTRFASTQHWRLAFLSIEARSGQPVHWRQLSKTYWRALRMRPAVWNLPTSNTTMHSTFRLH